MPGVGVYKMLLNKSNIKFAGATLGLGGAAMLTAPTFWRTMKDTWGGKGLGDALMDNVVDENFSKNGLLGTAKKIGFGQEASDLSVGQIVVDEVGGAGTFDKTRDVVGDTIDGAGNLISYAGSKAKGAVEGTEQMLDSIHGTMSAMVDQHFSVTDEEREAARLAQARQAMMSQAAMQQGYFPASYPQGVQPGVGQSVGGAIGSVGSTFGNLLNSFTGGGSNNVALVGLLAGAYMLFGGLGGGILSKIIGGAMGGYAFRHIANSNKQSQQQMAPMQYPSVSSGQFQERLQQSYEQQLQLAQGREKGQGTVVNRSI